MKKKKAVFVVVTFTHACLFLLSIFAGLAAEIPDFFFGPNKFYEFGSLRISKSNQFVEIAFCNKPDPVSFL